MYHGHSKATWLIRSSVAIIFCVGLIVVGGIHVYAQGAIPAFSKLTPRFIDDTFHPVLGGANGISSPANRTVIQPDGKILVAGNFQLASGVQKNGIARYNLDGSLDQAFNSKSGTAGGAINAIALQSTGKIIIVGAFTSFGGQPVGFIARLNTDGSLDTGFNSGGVLSGSGASTTINEVSVLPDDRIYISGAFTTYNGVAALRLARLNANGGLDTTFAVGTGPSSAATVIEQQPDGRILIAGGFTNYNGNTSAARFARVNSDGTLDTTFVTGTGPNSAPRTIDVLPDSKILIAGNFASYNGTTKNAVVRVNADGSLDNTYNVPGATANVGYMARQADDKLIVAGTFTAIAGSPRPGVARLNADGTLDNSFDPGTGINTAAVNSIAIQADGKAILAGAFTSYNGTSRQSMVRVNTDGSLDTSMNSQLTALGSLFAIARHTDGKLYIGGTLTSVDGTARANFARLNANGTHDLTFNPGTGPNAPIQTIGVQADGKAIISGNFTNYNGAPINRIARINVDGSLDTSFNVGTGLPDPGAQTIAVQPDGKILLGGFFTTYNSATNNRIVRLNTDGSLDASFVTATGPNNMIFKIVVQADGKIVIGGDFATVHGAAKRGVARLNADGTNDATFDQNGTGLAGRVTDLVVHNDGKIVAVGGFTTVNGTSRVRVARLNANGSLDTSFDPGVGFPTELQAIVLTPEGKYIVAGNFTTAQGLPRNKIARIRSNGTLDAKFLGGLGPAGSGNILRVIVPHNGRYLIGGQFDTYNTSARSGIVSISNATKAPVDYDGDGKTDWAIARHYGGVGRWTYWINYNDLLDDFVTFDFGVFAVDALQPGDFDGDGITDVAVWRGSSSGGEPIGYWIVLSSTNSVKMVPFGRSGDRPVLEDYDGDGKDDMAVWRQPGPTTIGQGTWFYRGSFNNPNGSIAYVPFGMRYGDQADQVDDLYPGDFDGDGRADFRIQRRVDTSIPTSNTPAIFYTLTATGNLSYDYFGLAGDRTIPGDYDGDGKTDLAIARGFNMAPSTTTWYIRYTSGIPDAAFQWGLGSYDQFAQGDYDGDGITDPTVYRRIGENNFYVRRSTDGMLGVFHWGQEDPICGPACDIAVATYNNR